MGGCLSQQKRPAQGAPPPVPADRTQPSVGGGSRAAPPSPHAVSLRQGSSTQPAPLSYAKVVTAPAEQPGRLPSAYAQECCSTLGESYEECSTLGQSYRTLAESAASRPPSAAPQSQQAYARYRGDSYGYSDHLQHGRSEPSQQTLRSRRSSRSRSQRSRPTRGADSAVAPPSSPERVHAPVTPAPLDDGAPSPPAAAAPSLTVGQAVSDGTTGVRGRLKGFSDDKLMAFVLFASPVGLMQVQRAVVAAAAAPLPLVPCGGVGRLWGYGERAEALWLQTWLPCVVEEYDENTETYTVEWEDGSCSLGVTSVQLREVARTQLRPSASRSRSRASRN